MIHLLLEGINTERQRRRETPEKVFSAEKIRDENPQTVDQFIQLLCVCEDQIIASTGNLITLGHVAELMETCKEQVQAKARSFIHDAPQKFTDQNQRKMYISRKAVLLENSRLAAHIPTRGGGAAENIAIRRIFLESAIEEALNQTMNQQTEEPPTKRIGHQIVLSIGNILRKI